MLSVKQVCSHLGVTRSTLRRIMLAGQIPYFKYGDARSAPVRFREEDVTEYMNRCLRATTGNGCTRVAPAPTLDDYDAMDYGDARDTARDE